MIREKLVSVLGAEFTTYYYTEDSRRCYDVDEKADFVLACTAKPRSDLLVRTHQQEAMLDHRAEHDLPLGSAKR